MICKRSKKAFTLYELVIAIALFLVVAALVIAFITFMTNYTEKNKQNANRAKQLNVARQEIDYWFSYFDSEDYDIMFNLPDSMYLVATSKTTGEKYYVQKQLVPNSDATDFEQKLVFCYPADSYAHGEQTEILENDTRRMIKRVLLDCEHIARLRVTLYSPPSQHSPESAQYLRILVEMPVTNKTFAVDMFYGTPASK